MPETERTFLAVEPKIENAITPLQVEIPEPPQEVVVLKTITPVIVKQMVIESAKKYEVPVKMAVPLAEFESQGFNHKAKNPISTAKGVFQFIDDTWRRNCEGEVFDPEANIECGMKLLAQRQIGHWVADPATRRVLVKTGYVICTDFEKNQCEANY